MQLHRLRPPALFKELATSGELSIPDRSTSRWVDFCSGEMMRKWEWWPTEWRLLQRKRNHLGIWGQFGLQNRKMSCTFSADDTHDPTTNDEFRNAHGRCSGKERKWKEAHQQNSAIFSRTRLIIDRPKARKHRRTWRLGVFNENLMKAPLLVIGFKDLRVSYGFLHTWDEDLLNSTYYFHIIFLG